MAKGGGRTQGIIDSAYDATTVVTSDGADLADGTTRAIYVGTGGDVSVDTAGGTTVLFKSVPDGTLLPIQVRRIRATSTTASNILALY